MTTYRERREQRAERLREWADKRQAKADVVHQEREQYAGDTAFWTQPGDIPQRTRLFRRMDRAREDSDKASEMQSRAVQIERQADHAIYSDDPDAIEALETRIAALEAERDAIKAYNASCRKGAPDVDLLTDSQRRDLASIKQVAAYSLGKGGAMPGYALTNLSGNISRQKKRLDSLRNPRPELPRLLNPVKYASECRTCGQTIERGESALYWKATKELEHDACYQREEATV